MYSLVYYFFYLLVFAIASIEIANNLSSNIIKRGKIIYFVANIIPSLIILNNKNRNLLLLVTIVTVFFVLYMNMKNISYSIAISVVTTIVLALADSVVGVFVVLVLKIHLYDIKEVSLNYFIMGVFVVLIAYGISIVLKKKINEVYTYMGNLNKKYSEIRVSVVIYLLFILLEVLVNLYSYRYFVGYINDTVVVINAFGIVINFVILTTLLYTNSKNIRNKLFQESKDKEFKQLEEYVLTMELIYDDLRRFKHDYKNIIESMGLYIYSEDINGLKNFYNKELILESQNIIDKDLNLNVLKNIKITSLKALISSKLIKAQALNIKVYVEVLKKIGFIAIKEFDICRIIGILLDNSIEAAVLCNEKFINIAIIRERNSVMFIIKNSCIENVPPIHVIRKKDFSTKGKDRGLGLSTVDDIIDNKYRNLSSNIVIKDNVFTYVLNISN